MNTLIRKEVRLLLPFWCIAVLLAVAPVWLFPRESFDSGVNGFVFWTFGFGLILVGMAPFGQEFSLGTFSSLLAQPLERERIWRIKIVLVSIAALLVLVALVLSVNLRLDALLREAIRNLAENRFDNYWDLRIKEAAAKNWSSSELWRTGFELMLAGIAGGLWATLLFRQTGAALWFAILVPGFLLVVVQGVFQLFSTTVAGNIESNILLAALGAYAITGFLWARRLFLCAQDAQWLGETISLLGLTPAKTQAPSLPPIRGKRPLRTLFKREIQSHQISFFIAFGLLVFHSCTLAVRKYHSFAANSEMRFALESVPFLWFLVPWLLGCVAIAEERKLGTLENQLSLPVARRLQFIVKFAVVLFLGIVLGGILPSGIEAVATALGISSDFFGTHFFAAGNLLSLGGHAAVIAGAIATVSFFASTLTRNTLHALGAAIVLAIAFFFLLIWTANESQRNYDYSLWNGPLIFFLGVPVFIIALAWLGFRNYQSLQVGRSIWLRNLVVLAVSLFLAGTATAAIYQRPWERMMTLEPHHRPARLSGPVRPMIFTPTSRTFVLLPDGRLWAARDFVWKQFDEYEDVWDSGAHTNRQRKLRVPIPTGGSFLGGSNWVALAATSGEVVALQSDGSLWRILSSIVNGTNLWGHNFWISLVPQPRRIGADSDWKSIGNGSSCFMAVKADGTLWGWGYNEDGRFAVNSREWVTEPVRIGTNSDWEKVFSQGNNVWPMKRDGALWTWLKIESPARFELRPTNLNGADWLAVAGAPYRNLVLYRDGTLWASGYLPRRLFGVRTRWGQGQELTRIGRESDWSQVAGNNGPFVAIKKDGTLVKSGGELFSSVLGQPSRHSDWLAVESDWDGLAAIAADGTISFWSDAYYWQGKVRFLAPTRAPRWSLNILTDSKN